MSTRTVVAAEHLSAGSRPVRVADHRARTVTDRAARGRPRALRLDDVPDSEDVLPGFSVCVGDILAPGP